VPHLQAKEAGAPPVALSAADDGDFMSDSDSGDDPAFALLQDDDICYHVIAAVIAFPVALSPMQPWGC